MIIIKKIFNHFYLFWNSVNADNLCFVADMLQNAVCKARQLLLNNNIAIDKIKYILN